MRPKLRNKHVASTTASTIQTTSPYCFSIRQNVHSFYFRPYTVVQTTFMGDGVMADRFRMGLPLQDKAPKFKTLYFKRMAKDANREFIQPSPSRPRLRPTPSKFQANTRGFHTKESTSIIYEKLYGVVQVTEEQLEKGGQLEQAWSPPERSYWFVELNRYRKEARFDGNPTIASALSAEVCNRVTPKNAKNKLKQYLYIL